MKNISFFDQMKCFLREECIKNIDLETKAKEEGSSPRGEQAKQIPTENLKQDTASKLNFQLFDIDQVFAN